MRHRRRPTGMQNNGTAHIAAVAARLMAEDGLDDVELAKRKAAHQLNLPEWIGLPSSAGSLRCVANPPGDFSR